MNYFKLNEQNYPMTYQGKATLDDTWKEFTVNDGVYYPAELNDAMVALKAKEDTDNQIAEAKAYLNDTMWINDKYTDVVLINKLMTDEEYKDKYSLEYQKRAEARALINSLEG